ncbi:uncharacterized protein LOC121027404 isoform X1 [Herpailurus yagouaroundi]|uniref:uncharacterized protein LOC121027404 isoform X1 n=2 Tax=Herpailurus yagouaroundi TaxID=1608482 RepID=UPI001AD699D2|nr:uncharacterized protein LOC121027404 isoform X1 [Puma yagouaroundi]
MDDPTGQCIYLACSFIEGDGRYAKRFSLPHSFETQAIPEIPLKIRLKFSNKGVWVCVWASVGESWRMSLPWRRNLENLTISRPFKAAINDGIGPEEQQLLMSGFRTVQKPQTSRRLLAFFAQGCRSVHVDILEENVQMFMEALLPAKKEDFFPFGSSLETIPRMTCIGSMEVAYSLPNCTPSQEDGAVIVQAAGIAHSHILLL